MDQKIEIVLTNYQVLYRNSLSALLKTQTEFEILGEASNGKGLLELLKQKRPDIVLFDIEMPDTDAKKILQTIKNRFPDVKVIILSSYMDINLVSHFILQGANSYLSKNCEAHVLFKAILAVKSEGYFFDNFTSRALLDTAKEGPRNETGFNERETEIVRKICDGKTNKEIASCLNLSTSTIDFHKGKIYLKAKCNNATELLKYALKKGIVALS